MSNFCQHEVQLQAWSEGLKVLTESGTACVGVACTHQAESTCLCAILTAHGGSEQHHVDLLGAGEGKGGV